MVQFLKTSFDTVGFYIVVASFIVLLAFSLRNLLKPGFAIITLGIFANALVSILNTGMPVVVEAGKKITETSVHQNAKSTDILGFLGDRFDFNLFSFIGLGQIISIGDVILGVGIIVLMFFASRTSSQEKVVIESNNVAPKLSRRERKAASAAGLLNPVSATPSVGYLESASSVSSESFAHQDNSPVLETEEFKK
jgi:hypothetical protein